MENNESNDLILVQKEYCIDTDPDFEDVFDSCGGFMNENFENFSFSDYPMSKCGKEIDIDIDASQINDHPGICLPMLLSYGSKPVMKKNGKIDTHKNYTALCTRGEHSFQTKQGKTITKPSFKTEMNHFGDEIPAEKIIGVDDVYISFNSYYQKCLPKKSKSGETAKYSTGRNASNICQLTGFFVDVDCESVGLSKDEALTKIHSMYNSTILTPTMIIDTGHGFHVFWKTISNRYRGKKRWERMEEKIVSLLAPVGADINAKDCTRMLRVPGSINAKYPSCPVAVKCVEYNPVCYTTYSVDKFMCGHDENKNNLPSNSEGSGVYPYGQATQNQRDYARNLSQKTGLKIPKNMTFKSYDKFIKKCCKKLYGKAYSNETKAEYYSKKAQNFGCWRTNVIRDITNLYANRKGNDCRNREIACWIVFNLSLEDFGVENSWEIVREFNQSLDSPLSDEELESKMKVSENRYIREKQAYHFKKETIIEYLNISEDEYGMVPSLTDVSYKAKKEKEASEKRKIREEKRNEKMEMIRAEIIGGADDAAIAGKLHVSRETVACERQRLRVHSAKEEKNYRERYSVVHDMVEKGMSVREISRKLHLSTRDVSNSLKMYQAYHRKFLPQGEIVEYAKEDRDDLIENLRKEGLSNSEIAHRMQIKFVDLSQHDKKMKRKEERKNKKKDKTVENSKKEKTPERYKRQYDDTMKVRNDKIIPEIREISNNAGMREPDLSDMKIAKENTTFARNLGILGVPKEIIIKCCSPHIDSPSWSAVNRAGEVGISNDIILKAMGLAGVTVTGNRKIEVKDIVRPNITQIAFPKYKAAHIPSSKREEFKTYMKNLKGRKSALA